MKRFTIRGAALSVALATALAASAAGRLSAQAGAEVLTNESVTQMITAKVPKDLILTKIRTTKSNFDLTPAGLIGLHTSHASDETIKAMMASVPATAPKETLNNDAVMQMVTGMLSKDIIMLKVQASKGDYDLTTNGLIRLNQGKVSQDVIKAMMAAPAAPAHRP